MECSRPGRASVGVATTAEGGAPMHMRSQAVILVEALSGRMDAMVCVTL